jgi:hypothetical protein
MTSVPISSAGISCSPETFQLAHDPGDGALDAIRIDRPLAQRDLEGAQKLVAVERHLAAALLDHVEIAELDALEGGEAAAAIRADAAAANGGAVFGGRLSFTWVSRDWQNGQRMERAC